MVSRHESFESFFDAEERVNLCLLSNNRYTHTFQHPANLDYIWKWHSGGEVETYCFKHESLYSKQALSVVLYSLLGTSDHASIRKICYSPQGPCPLPLPPIWTLLRAPESVLHTRP